MIRMESINLDAQDTASQIVELRVDGAMVSDRLPNTRTKIKVCEDECERMK